MLPELTKTGKRFDRLNPYRLVVEITKGDPKGELLTNLCRGLIIGHATLESAQKAQAEYHKTAATVLASNYGNGSIRPAGSIHDSPDFSSYGFSVIVNEATGEMSDLTHIG